MGSRSTSKGASEQARAVARVVKAIPRGQVSSYSQVAKRAGLSAGPRGVARALGQVEDVPWWRVIRADGTLAPEVAEEQARLLRREGIEVRGRRVVGASSARGTRSALPERRTVSISTKPRKGP